MEQGFWLPADARRARRTSWIPNGTIRDYLRGIRARHILLITDACFGGSLLLRDPPDELSTLEYARLPSRTAITSGALTTVPDRSVFAQYLVKALHEADERVFTAGTLFGRLRRSVPANSPTRQIPQFAPVHDTGHEGGEFVFLRRQPPSRPTEASPASPGSARDRAAALAHAWSLRREILSGVPFEVVARRESADSPTAVRGGDLGEFGRGTMIEPFERAAFSLPVGAVSEPVLTQYGYHLIRVTRRDGDRVAAGHIMVAIAAEPEPVRSLAELPDTLTPRGAYAIAKDLHELNRFEERNLYLQLVERGGVWERNAAASLYANQATQLGDSAQELSLAIGLTRRAIELSDPEGTLRPVANFLLALKLARYIHGVDADAELQRSCTLAQRVRAWSDEARAALAATGNYDPDGQRKLHDYLEQLAPRTAAMLRSYC
jgi:hypothetical protein